MNKQSYKKAYNPELIKFVESITSKPSGPEKWGMAMKAWLMRNEIIDTPEGPKTAQEYNELQVAFNQRLRDEQMNRFGATESGALRIGLSIPEGMWSMIKLCDPPAFNQGHGNYDLVRDNLRKFMKAFPQYAIPEKI